MRWTLKPKPSEEKVKSLSQALNVEEFIAALLIQRGVETFEQAKDFFRPSLSHLHDPYLMKDMDKAVARIEQAISQNERILVFGDYDVDGTTAVALVSSYLKTFYPHIETYIPDRYKEGYGVSYAGIDFAHEQGYSLIIALDCGIKSIDHVAYARERNIDFVICDHHRPGDSLPNAVAILDPKRDDCSYPYDELCGCGVGFKLIQALGKNRNQTIEDLIPYLDLVATAIAADIVPITGENRVLAYFGLQRINSSPRAGIKALTQQLKKKSLLLSDVVYTIVPRINAAGRIKHGNHAVSLLASERIEQAERFASEIEQYNTQRKGLDQQITQEALAQIVNNGEENNYSSVVFQENWHKGVIGIVASRLIETYYRPTLVFTKSGDKYAASARSVKGFDVYNALEACSEHLEQFGGHMYAAGMTLKQENYEAFKNAFEQTVKQSINPDLLVPEITIDAELNFSDISPKMLRILKQFEPFGPSNTAPVFLSRNIIDTGHPQKLGAEGQHIKLYLYQKDPERFSAIGFGLADKLPLTQKGKPFDAVYSIEENHWNDQITIQLQLRDLK